MKSVSKLLVEWDTLKMKEPAGWGETYTDRFQFIRQQHSILRELIEAGCSHIPGESLPVSEMIAEREKLISHWR